MSTQRHHDIASNVDGVDGCVTGTFTRDYVWRSSGTSYVSVEFVASCLDFTGSWVVFRDPAFVEIWHHSGYPSGRPEVKSYTGTHRVAASRVREITYDHADCVP